MNRKTIQEARALGSSPEVRFWTCFGDHQRCQAIGKVRTEICLELDTSITPATSSNLQPLGLTFNSLSTAIMAQPALNKISANSPSRQHPSELETNIATALYELETNIPDLKSALRPLQFVSAREVCCGLLLSLHYVSITLELHAIDPSVHCHFSLTGLSD